MKDITPDAAIKFLGAIEGNAKCEVDDQERAARMCEEILAKKKVPAWMYSEIRRFSRRYDTTIVYDL